MSTSTVTLDPDDPAAMQQLHDAIVRASGHPYPVRLSRALRTLAGTASTGHGRPSRDDALAEALRGARRVPWALPLAWEIDRLRTTAPVQALTAVLAEALADEHSGVEHPDGVAVFLASWLDAADLALVGIDPDAREWWPTGGGS